MGKEEEEVEVEGVGVGGMLRGSRRVLMELIGISDVWGIAIWELEEFKF